MTDELNKKLASELKRKDMLLINKRLDEVDNEIAKLQRKRRELTRELYARSTSP